MKRNYRTYRWAVWGVMIFIYFIGFFQRMSVGALSTDLQREFSLSSTALGAFSSIYFYVYMVMQIPAGVLADTLGARKTVTIGGLVAAFGSILFGLAPTVTVAYVSRFLVGLGVSVVLIPILASNTRWFYPREQATMTGLGGFVGNIGGMLAQTPLVLLSAAITWRLTFISIGAVSILGAVICFLVVRDTPEEVGLPPVAPAPPKKEKVNFAKAYGEAFRTPAMWPLFTASFVVYGSIIAFTGTFALQYLSDAFKMDETHAGNLTLIFTIFAAASNLGTGVISDRLGRRKPLMLICMSANLLVWIVMAFFSAYLNTALLCVIMVLFGIAGGVLPLSLTIAKEVSSPALTGVSTALTNTFSIIGASVLPILFGAALDHFRPLFTGHALYSRAFFVLLIIAAVGFVIVLTTKETHCRNIYEEK